METFTWPEFSVQIGWFMRGFWTCMGFVVIAIAIRVFRKLGDGGSPEL